MATAFKSIPLIDISPLLAKWDDPNMAEDKGVAEVVRQLDQAGREAGFFYVISLTISSASFSIRQCIVIKQKGHGIPDSLVKEVRSVTHKFFDLPYEEKTKIKLSAATGYRPTNPPNFRHLMELYISLCTDLSRKIMRGIALALGGSVDELEGKRAGDPFWALRIIGYPGLSCGQDMSNSDIGCGAHTDYVIILFFYQISGLLTLVNQDDDITALQILSNGLYESTLHRVINKSPKYRVCVAYFYEPNFNAAIEPLDACIENSGGTKKFEAAGEHLISKILTNFVHQS
ncbi:hypothetical protein RJ639_004341 [Escallonia herrerae]|uniref:Uncharacterized protein n=1 Tax=Escallonia herrerae TaxID=1293975 RepID=A0AA88W471_9ASTE|nr:hypothetical protein RJ639_004341 [Escallonia herrerae]